jgi:hypothetical protein
LYSSKLRVIRIAVAAEPLVEQVMIGFDHRQAVQIEGPAAVHRFAALAHQVGQLGKRIQLFGRRFALADFVQLADRFDGMVRELRFQVVAAQQELRPLGRLRAAGRKQLQGPGQRVVRRLAHANPARLGAARQAADDEQPARRQIPPGAWERRRSRCWRAQSHALFRTGHKGLPHENFSTHRAAERRRALPKGISGAKQ